VPKAWSQSYHPELQRRLWENLLRHE
jgi:hypothetical protein